MDNIYYDLNKLGNYTSLLKYAPKDWAYQMKQWLHKEILKISQCSASLSTLSYDGSAPIDFDLFEQLSKSNYDLIVSEITDISAGLRDDFLSRLRWIKETQNSFDQLRAQGLLFRLKNKKIILETKQKLSELQKFSFCYLARVACSFYVEQGLGSAEDAKSYFFN